MTIIERELFGGEIEKNNEYSEKYAVCYGKQRNAARVDFYG